MNRLPLFLAPPLGLALVVLALSMAGCASVFGSAEDDYTIEQGEIASYALPGTREVAHHPDSLCHLRIVEKNGRLDFRIDPSYKGMLLEWTAAQRGSSRSYFRTHATLWSKELSLASLIPERGIDILSRDLAREMLRERTAEYDSLVQIDVYIFASSLQHLDLGDLWLDTPGRRVYLRRDDDDTLYEPVRIESGVPREAFHAGRQGLYGRSALFFQRHTEEGEALLDAERLRLYVRPDDYYFTWTFSEEAGV